MQENGRVALNALFSVNNNNNPIDKPKVVPYYRNIVCSIVQYRR